MKNVATFVRARRAKFRLTQVDLAHRAQVGLRFIRELEAGKETARCDKVNKVLQLFGHTLGPVQVSKTELTGEGE
jgi:y4mF family transcriptional regulator